MDIFTKEKRSRVMSSIKNKDTKPEIKLRKALFKNNFRYRVHKNTVEGKPDVYLKKYNAAIFLHGCFWHGHDCKAATLPKTRRDFWENKITNNKIRDNKIVSNIIFKGLRVLIIWECSFKGKGKIRFNDVISKTIKWIISEKTFEEISNYSFDLMIS